MALQLYAHTSYLYTIHLHIADMSKTAGDAVAEERWRKLATTFLVAGNAAIALRDDVNLEEKEQNPFAPGQETSRTLTALEDYVYNVGKCEYKNILGHGRPAVEDCSEHGFFMVDERARVAMDKARQSIDLSKYPTQSYWSTPASKRDDTL